MKKLILGAVVGVALGALGMFFAMPRPTPAVCPDNQAVAIKPAEAPKPASDTAPKVHKNVHLSQDVSDINKHDDYNRKLDKLP